MELIVPFLSFMFLKHHHTNNENGGSIEEHKSSMGSNSTNSSKSTKSSKSSKSSKSAHSQVSWTSRFKIVPIMVGSCKPNQHALYGQILSKYFEDESTLFVISSDFCHWGNNYGYVPFEIFSSVNLLTVSELITFLKISIYHRAPTGTTYISYTYVRYNKSFLFSVIKIFLNLTSLDSNGLKWRSVEKDTRSKKIKKEQEVEISSFLLAV